MPAQTTFQADFVAYPLEDGTACWRCGFAIHLRGRMVSVRIDGRRAGDLMPLCQSCWETVKGRMAAVEADE